MHTIASAALGFIVAGRPLCLHTHHPAGVEKAAPFSDTEAGTGGTGASTIGGGAA